LYTSRMIIKNRRSRRSGRGGGPVQHGIWGTRLCPTIGAMPQGFLPPGSERGILSLAPRQRRASFLEGPGSRLSSFVDFLWLQTWGKCSFTGPLRYPDCVSFSRQNFKSLGAAVATGEHPWAAMQRRDDDLYSSMDSMASRASRSLNTGSASGVGIFFQQESDGKVYVKTIVSGGSAERDGAPPPTICSSRSLARGHFCRALSSGPLHPATAPANRQGH